MILKIQLLRLVHNFCSHSAYKHVLLSYGELDELKQLYTAYGDSSAAAPTLDTTALPYCNGGSGLLTKIIRVLANVPSTSIFRYSAPPWSCESALALRSVSTNKNGWFSKWIGWIRKAESFLEGRGCQRCTRHYDGCHRCHCCESRRRLTVVI